jgi:hypothetical protein
MFTSLFADGSLINYITQNTIDPWIGTPFEGYVYMSPKQKGEFGERFVSLLFEKQILSTVKKAPKSTSGYDRIIDGFKTEIKFSLATRKGAKIKKDSFIINHVSEAKDWDRLVFFGINPEEKDCRFFWFSKEDFVSFLRDDDCCFNVQQGGKKIKNDDYMCTQVARLMEQPFIRTIPEW